MAGESFTEFTEDAFGAFIEDPTKERGPGLKPCPQYSGPRDGYGPNFIGLVNSFDISVHVDPDGPMVGITQQAITTVSGGDITGGGVSEDSYTVRIASPALHPGAYAGHFSVSCADLLLGGIFEALLIANLGDLNGFSPGNGQPWVLVPSFFPDGGSVFQYTFNRVWGPLDPFSGIIIPPYQRGPASGIESRDYDKIIGPACPFKVFFLLQTQTMDVSFPPGTKLVKLHAPFDFSISGYRIY